MARPRRRRVGFQPSENPVDLPAKQGNLPLAADKVLAKKLVSFQRRLSALDEWAAAASERLEVAEVLLDQVKRRIDKSPYKEP